MNKALLPLIEEKDGKYVGKHTKEQLADATRTGSLDNLVFAQNDEDITYSTLPLNELLAKVTSSEGSIDSENSDPAFVDYVDLGDNSYQVTAVKATSKLLNDALKVDIRNFKMVSRVETSATSYHSDIHPEILGSVPILNRMGKSYVKDGQLHKAFTATDYSLPLCLLEDPKYPEVLRKIEDTILMFKACCLVDTFSDKQLRGPEKYQAEYAITNNSALRIKVSQLLSLDPDIKEDRDVISDIMDCLHGELGIKSFTTHKIGFGIDVNTVTKTDTPKWTSDRNNRTYKVSESYAMRIKREPDTFSYFPVLPDKIDLYKPIMLTILQAFTMWAEMEARYIGGLKETLKPEDVIKHLEGLPTTEQRPIYAVMGLKLEVADEAVKIVDNALVRICQEYRKNLRIDKITAAGGRLELSDDED